MKKGITSCLLIVLSFYCSAQDWALLYQQSVEFYENLELRKAKDAAESALQLFKSSADPDKNLAVILRQLSIVTYELGESDLAVGYAQEEVTTLQDLHLDTDLNFSYCLHNLAVIRMGRSEYGAAEPLLIEAHRLAQDALEEDSYELAVIRGNLATTLFNLQKDEEAEPLFKSAISTMENLEEIGLEYYGIIYGYAGLLSEHSDFEQALPYLEELEEYYSFDKPNFEYGSIELKIGDVLDLLGRFQEAVEKYRSAIENFKSMGEQEAAEYSIALNNFSIELQKVGRFDEAFSIMEELIVQKEGKRAERPLEYALALTNYANLLVRNGKNGEAGEKLKMVFELYRTDSLEKDLTYVNALEASAGIELASGNISKADDQVMEGIVLAEADAYHGKQYSLYNLKAKVRARQSRFEEARSVAQKAVNISQQSFGNDALQTAFAKNTLAGILSELGEYDQAGKMYEEVLVVFGQTYGDENPETAKIMTNYSSLLQQMGNYNSAENYLMTALGIKERAFGREHPDFLITYENLALLYQNTARYTSADQLLSEIVAIKEKLFSDVSPELAYTYLNLGTSKKQLADYTASEAYLKKAVFGYKGSLGTNHIFYAGALNAMALLYQKMGNMQAAKPLFEEALTIYENTVGKETPDYATALENLATLYQMEEDYSTAKKLLEEALVIDEKVLGTDHPLYSKTLHNLASIYEESGEYDRAEELYMRALAIDERVFGVDHPSYAATLYNLAVLEQELEDYQQAKAHYEQVVDIRRKVLGENHPDFTYSLYGFASILHKTNELEAAKAPYQSVVLKYLEYIEKYFPALSENEKSAFYGRIRPVFENYMDYALEFVLLNKGTAQDRSEMIGSLYNLQLATKALLLNASNKVRNRINSSGDPELITLFNEWVAMKENLVKAYSMSVEETGKAGISIGELETNANETEKRLSLKSSAFAQEFEKKTVTWQDVKSQLGSGEAALEVIRIRKKMKKDSILYVTLILRNDKEYPVLSTNANGMLMESSAFKLYKNSILYKLQDTKSYDTYWAEIDKNLEGISTIFLSADGALNKINIATLYNPKEKKYLVEKYKIRLLSNSRELVDNSPAKNPRNTASMFGFPTYNLGQLTKDDGSGIFADENTRASAFGSTISELPGTLEEVNTIDAILVQNQWQSEKYLAATATEDQVKKIESPKILHIATHGFFLEDIRMSEDQGGISSRNARYNPLLRSGLLFAGAENTWRNEKISGKEDGILTAYEAMNLNLDNTELVVMSACETGLGEVKNGEGVYGLQRSFLVAGADNLVMSLWKVNDETTQLLMSSFYKNWFSGKTRLDAFNIAIDEVRSAYKEPYYWGAFVILGN